MTQLTLNIENISILPQSKQMISGFEGVSIAKTQDIPAFSGIEESLENVRNGRVTHYETAEDFFKAFGI